jgi:NADH:flavin oxidoreductase / NADH oxidase family
MTRPQTANAPRLLDPLSMGSLQLPNRVIMSPLTRCRASEGGVPNALMGEYYRQRASAGLRREFGRMNRWRVGGSHADNDLTLKRKQHDDRHYVSANREGKFGLESSIAIYGHLNLRLELIACGTL